MGAHYVKYFICIIIKLKEQNSKSPIMLDVFGFPKNNI